MRKFSKLLTLILSLVLIVAAFTVVALAEESPAPKKFDNGYGSFDSRDEGARLSYDRNAWATVQIQDNGNKYMLTHDAPEGYKDTLSTTSGSYTQWTNPQMDIGTGLNNTYNILAYPYFLLEFDVTTLNGTYYGFSIDPRLYIGSSSLGFLGGTKLADITELSTISYDWKHFSLIIEYNGGGKFTQHIYVNGEFVKSVPGTDLSSKITSEAIEKTVVLKYFKGYPNTKSDIAIDNMYFTLFPAGYRSGEKDLLDTIANYSFNHGEGYEFPYKYTVAKIGDTVYDDLNEAIAAGAESGETVKLTENAKQTLVINKNVTIDTNIYDEEGNATGSFYTYTYTSSRAMVPTETAEGSGIYSFARDPKAVNVIWDEACEGECGCFAEYGRHQLSADTLFVVGETPTYPAATPVYDMANDFSHKVFLGWSYENDGTVDTINAITEEDLAAGTAIKLYPVYKTRQYTVTITNSAGVVSYYDGETLDASAGSIPANSTVQLFGDTVITTQLELPNRNNITFDLNGYALSKQETNVTNYEATLGENGEYVKGNKLGTESYGASGSYVFYFGNLSSSYSFTLKSSRPGATIGGMTVSADRWIYNGEVVKTENTTVTGEASLFSFYPISGTVNMYGENITYYVRTVIYGEHGGNGSEKINIDGGTFVNLGSTGEGIFALRNGEKVTFKNATFYCNGTQLVRNAGGTGNRNKNTEITFENCKIYDAVLYSNAPTDKYTFNNCIADITLSSGTTAQIVIGKNTVTTKDIIASYANASLADGLEGETISRKHYYNNVSKDQIIFDLETLTPTANVTNNYTSDIFVYLAKGDDTKMATVTWKDADGNVLAVTEEISGLLAFAPKVPWGDGYRGVVNAVWVDAQGAEANLVIGDADSYEFTAVLPAKEDASFVADLSNVMMNMGYYGHFAYNLFVPVVEGVEIVKLGDYTPGIVKIDGVEYYVSNCGWPSPTSAIKTIHREIQYIIDGVTYSAYVDVSALIYADILLYTNAMSDVERDAALKMIAYIEQVYLFKAEGNVLDAETQAKFDTFFGNYNGGARPANEEPAETEIQAADESLKAHIASTTFAIYSNNRMTFLVTLTKEAVEKGYTASVSGVASGFSGSKANEDGTVTYYTDNNTLTGGIMASKYVITISDSEKNVVAKMNYNLATYANAVDIPMVNAFYTFGKAAVRARHYLSTL